MVPSESFFSFFSPPSLDDQDDDEDEEGDAIEAKLELDYQIGEDLKERVSGALPPCVIRYLWMLTLRSLDVLQRNRSFPALSTSSPARPCATPTAWATWTPTMSSTRTTTRMWMRTTTTMRPEPADDWPHLSRQALLRLRRKTLKSASSHKAGTQKAFTI